jgi:aminopeptidase N
MVRRPVAMGMALAVLAACSSGDTGGSGPGRAPGPSATAPATTATTAGSVDPATGGVLDAVGRDSVLPGLGSAAIDVEVYDVALDTDAVGTSFSSARASLQVRPRRPVSRLTFDFALTDVVGVTVDGRPVPAEADGRHLTVESGALPADRTVTVEVRYRGRPKAVPTRALRQVAVGWQAGREGSVVLSEPEGAAGWVPVNDTVLDKATWAIAVTVPAGRAAVASGRLRSVSDGSGGRRTFNWAMDRPLATYQVTVAVGDLRPHDGGVVDGVTYRYWTVADRPLPPALAASAEVVARLQARLGPFPYDVYGGLVYPPGFVPEGGAQSLLTAVAFEAPGVSLYGEGRATADVVAHETAHQWLGDSVSVLDWGRDLWWVEGFARFAEVAVVDPAALDAPSTFRAVERECGGRAASPLALDDLFSPGSYDCGALVFAALRREVGDGTFWRILRTFATRYAHGHAGTDDLVAVASEVAGRDLEGFVRTWLSADRPEWR